MQGAQNQLRVAAGQIGAADRTGEEGIAGEEQIFWREVEADAPLRVPARNPRRRTARGCGTSMAVTLTRGLPDFAMMNGSPSTACSMRRERRFFASVIVTVRGGFI